MRCVFVGIEYAGKSTLITLLGDYYRQRRLPVHGDDHFTLPDASLSPESRALMVNFPDDVKERSQRMQIQYHVEVIKNYPNTLIAGWHMRNRFTQICTAMTRTTLTIRITHTGHNGFTKRRCLKPACPMWS